MCPHGNTLFWSFRGTKWYSFIVIIDIRILWSTIVGTKYVIPLLWDVYSSIYFIVSDIDVTGQRDVCHYSFIVTPRFCFLKLFFRGFTNRVAHFVRYIQVAVPGHICVRSDASCFWGHDILKKFIFIKQFFTLADPYKSYYHSHSHCKDICLVMIFSL